MNKNTSPKTRKSYSPADAWGTPEHAAWEKTWMVDQRCKNGKNCTCGHWSAEKLAAYQAMTAKWR